VFSAGHSEDACEDSLIEWFQSLELIEPRFDATELQGVLLQQGVHVADLAVSGMALKSSGWFTQVMNQLEPPFGDLVEIDVMFVVTGGCQARDRLPRSARSYLWASWSACVQSRQSETICGNPRCSLRGISWASASIHRGSICGW